MSTTSSTSRTRATNLTGLIDIDALVEAQTLRQKTKINTATQNLKIEQYKQEQYREIQTKAKKFYNKYFDVLSGDSLFNAKTYNTMKATSTASGSVTATASTTAKAGSYKVSVSDVATSAQYMLDGTSLVNAASTGSKTITINGKDFTLSGTDAKTIANNLNKDIANYNSESANVNNQIKVNASYSNFVNNGTGGLVLQTTNTGLGANLSVSINGGTTSTSTGQNATATITDIATGLSVNKTSSSNSITLDGVTFNLTDEVTDAVITVKPDGTELKDKIMEFIDDYNDLMGSINTKLYEKYDRSYKPLTDDDKEGLSDSEIEKLEAKAQIGLLRNDKYLSEFAEDMKLTMSTVMKKDWGGSSVGLSLEKIGIKPVNDFTAQNGLYKVNEETLLKAIENNMDGVKELFTRGMANSSSSESDGVFTKLSVNLKEHATNVYSKLANRAGVADGVSANTNEMTKDIEKRKKLLTEMQTALTQRENNLYTKYSRLESSLSALQSQQSSLSSYFSS